MADLSTMKSGALILAIDGHDETTCDCVCCAEWNRRRSLDAEEDYDPAADFAATGTVRCDDCGARVRPRTLESLPEHGCVERQRARRAASQTEEG